MDRTPREEAERWRLQAEADLNTAQTLFENERFGPCAFFCQQAAEKALKALLYSKGIRVLGHSIVGLLGRVTEEGFPEPDEAVKAARELVLQEKVDFLAGCITSAVGLAISAYAKEAISRLRGYELRFSGPTFNEFVVRAKRRTPAQINRALLAKRIIGGLELGRFYPELADCLLLCVTEQNSREEIDALCKVMGGAR